MISFQLDTIVDIKNNNNFVNVQIFMYLNVHIRIKQNLKRLPIACVILYISILAHYKARNLNAESDIHGTQQLNLQEKTISDSG